LIRVPSYWEARRDLRYYGEVVLLARAHVPAGRSVLDVGANETEVLERLEWFERRVALDVNEIPPRAGVETVAADFNEFEPAERFDLVLCLQVLEHLDRPGPFARKLLAAGRTTIISVPHEWPELGDRGARPRSNRRVEASSVDRARPNRDLDHRGPRHGAPDRGVPVARQSVTRSISPSGIWRNRVPSSRNDSTSPVHTNRYFPSPSLADSSPRDSSVR
jgi:hypothetical protein